MYKHTILAIGCVALGACSTQDTDVVAKDQGSLLFATHCAACHDNAAGQVNTLTRAAPDLTKIADRRNGVWPILEVMSIIEGYAKLSPPREGMPAIPAITEGSVVPYDTGNGLTQTVPANLLAVAEYLESIQSPAPTRYVP